MSALRDAYARAKRLAEEAAERYYGSDVYPERRTEANRRALSAARAAEDAAYEALKRAEPEWVEQIFERGVPF